MDRLVFIFLGLFVFGCGNAVSDENENTRSENKTDTVVEEEIDEVEDIESKEDFIGVETKHVLFCRIGDYEEPAIMVLDWGIKDENGIFPISGYYYYLKHSKNIDLNGYSEPRDRKIYLTESYKGEETGYMEFVQDDVEGISFWAPGKDSDDHQAFYSEDVLFADPYEFNIALTNEQYIYEHEVIMFDGPEDYTMEAKNEMFISRINDEFLAFDLSVVCTNGHVGAVNGLAAIEGNQSFYKDKVDDEFEKCILTFDLAKENEITVIEEDCNAFHGARAYFDCTLEKIK